MRAVATVALFLASGAAAHAHRLDEYLQATLISVEKNRIQAEIRLTPGIAVIPVVLASIDTNGDGVIVETEQRAYAERVLRELSLKLDGEPLRLRLMSAKFPPVSELKEGHGEIQIELAANFYTNPARTGSSRRLVFENRHLSGISAYLVNCLVPHDPDLQVVAQNRNYLQSFYQLEYTQAGVSSHPLLWLGAGAFLLAMRVAWHLATAQPSSSSSSSST
jgi:hypothetical protein